MAMTRARLLAVAAIFASRVATAAGDPSLPLPVETGKVESVQLGAAREFWVSLPDGYRDGAKRYPVVYLMDGEINFNSGLRRWPIHVPRGQLDGPARPGHTRHMARQTARGRRPLVLKIELERERETGRWIAEVTSIPGVMVYGSTQLDAFRRAQALAFEVIADRLKRGENPLTGHPTRPQPIGDIRFDPARQVAVAR
jgi:predicted RNase H-like HicB family nuclease